MEMEKVAKRKGVEVCDLIFFFTGVFVGQLINGHLILHQPSLTLGYAAKQFWVDIILAECVLIGIVIRFIIKNYHRRVKKVEKIKKTKSVGVKDFIFIIVSIIVGFIIYIISNIHDIITPYGLINIFGLTSLCAILLIIILDGLILRLVFELLDDISELKKKKKE